MARINPVQISWSAPTENTDGTPVVEALSYRLAVDGADFLDFPGTLNQDGRYSEATEFMSLPEGVVLNLTLRAFYVNEPNLISDPSNAIEIILGVSNPNPPFGLSNE